MKKRVLATALAAAMAGSMLAGFTTQAEDLGDPVRQLKNFPAATLQ